MKLFNGRLLDFLCNVPEKRGRCFHPEPLDFSTVHTLVVHHKVMPMSGKNKLFGPTHGKIDADLHAVTPFCLNEWVTCFFLSLTVLLL